jgi:hypothetical protein
MCLFYILLQVQDFTQYLGNTVRVILIPSVRDAHHDFIFPQVCMTCGSDCTIDLTTSDYCIVKHRLFLQSRNM